MPGLNGAAYEINSWANLNPELPGILKDYAKAAIRTDPIDLLQWSRDYFRALSKGLPPLEKDRWEDTTLLPAREGRTGITVGLLRLLHKQLSCRAPEELTLNEVSQHWTSLGLERQRLDDLLELVAMATTAQQPPPEGSDPSTSIVDWNKLLALAAGQLGASLGETMERLCVILSEDEDGGSSVPVHTFIEMYTYLANIDGDINQEEIEAVVEYAGRVAQLQDGTINLYNMKSPLCPNMH